MKKRFPISFAVLFLILIALPATVSAELMDKYEDPVPVLSSGSFEATDGTRLDFNLEGGTLTGAHWTVQRHVALYSLEGTFKEGEDIALSVKGTESPHPDDEYRVFNSMTVTLNFLDKDGQSIGGEQRYESDTVKDRTLNCDMGSPVPPGTVQVSLRGGFNCRWSVPYSGAVVEEMLSVTATLKPEKDVPPAVPPAAVETDPEPGEPPEPGTEDDIPGHTPDESEGLTEEYDWSMGLVPDGRDWVHCDCEDDPWEKHAGPLGAAIISIIAAIGALLGGAGGPVGAALAGAVKEALGLAGEAAGAVGEGLAGGDHDHGEERAAGEPPDDTAYGPPETMEVVVDHGGTRVEYVKDEQTGEWVNPLTGGVFDPEAYEKIVKPAMEKNRGFDQEAWQRNVDGTTGFDWELYGGEIDRLDALDKLEKQLKLERLELKYGVKGEQAVITSIEEAMAAEREWSEMWRGIGDNFRIMEDTAEFADRVIDAGLYGASYAVPGGKHVYAGYKGVKGVTVTMAEKGVSWKTLGSGAARGFSDAARVYVGSPYAKAAVSFAGETAAGAMEAKDWKEGAAKGAARGAVKAVVLGVTDKIGKATDAYGDVVTKSFIRGDAKFYSNMINDRIIKPSLNRALK